MKISNILFVSIQNILHKKRAYFKVLVGFFLVFLINFTIIFYAGSLSNAYKAFENGNANYAMIRALYNFSDEQLSELISDSRIKSIRYGNRQYLDNDLDIDIAFGKNNLSITIEESNFNVFYVNKNGTVLPENISLAFKEKTAAEPIKYGRNIQNTEDVIISEQIAESLGILPDDIIGERIKIVCGEYELNGVVCGVLDKRIMYTYNWCSSDIICYQSDEIESNVYEISLKNFIGNEELIENIAKMIPEGKGVSYWFGDYIINKIQVVEAQEELCSKFLSFMSVIVFFVMCVYVGCNQFYLMRKNSVFYGLLKSNGVSNKNIFIIHFLELFLLCLFSLALGVLCSVGILFVLQYAMANAFSISISFPFLSLIWSIPLFIFVGAVLSCLLTLYIYLHILKKPPIHLLNTGR
jgi:hypothetical protein